jgi:hypothetical protein
VAGGTIPAEAAARHVTHTKAGRALELIRNPESGRVIPGTGGLRKLRWAASGRGKRGGARVIYFWHSKSQQLLMLFVYSKNERSDLTTAQRRALRTIVETEYP